MKYTLWKPLILSIVFKRYAITHKCNGKNIRGKSYWFDFDGLFQRSGG